jgi:hypothetical protein
VDLVHRYAGHAPRLASPVSRTRSAAGACTSPAAPNIPDNAWVTQQARQVTWTIAEQPERIRVLIRDHDRKFTRSFDEVFRGAGFRIVRTPIQAPHANAIAGRFVRTVRAECLDWLLIMDIRHLDRVLNVFIDHYNRHRAHRGLKLFPPDRGTTAVTPPAILSTGAAVRRRDRLGGLLHEYRLAA